MVTHGGHARGTGFFPGATQAVPEANNLPAKVEFLPPEDQEHLTDLDYARKNIYGAIEHAQKGLEELREVAFSSQHPRAYEVQHQYLKTIAELNKDLVQISKTKKQEKEPGPVEKDGHVTQNLFVGSTKELGELLKKK